MSKIAHVYYHWLVNATTSCFILNKLLSELVMIECSSKHYVTLHRDWHNSINKDFNSYTFSPILATRKALNRRH